jgi:hypothetical protein
MGKIDLLRFIKPDKKPDFPAMTNEQYKILARVARTGGLGPIKKTTMEDLNKTKVEHSIDLRKEKSMSNTTEENTLSVVANMPEQHKLVTQELQEPKRMPPLKKNEKQISIIIDMKLIDGDIDFMERAKLSLLNRINDSIVGTCTVIKDAKGYTQNKIEINTEIICR